MPPISKWYTFPWTGEEHHQIHERNINNRKSLQKHPHHRKGRQTPIPRGRRLVAGKTIVEKQLPKRKSRHIKNYIPFHEQVRSTIKFMKGISTTEKAFKNTRTTGRGAKHPHPGEKTCSRKNNHHKEKAAISKWYTFPWTGEKHHQIHVKNINKKTKPEKTPAPQEGAPNTHTRGKRLISRKKQ